MSLVFLCPNFSFPTLPLLLDLLRFQGKGHVKGKKGLPGGWRNPKVRKRRFNQKVVEWGEIQFKDRNGTVLSKTGEGGKPGGAQTGPSPLPAFGN